MRPKINPYEVTLVVCLFLASAAAFALALSYSTRGRLFPLIVIVLLMIMLALKLIAILNPKMAARIDIQGIELPDSKAVDKPAEDAMDLRTKITKWPNELMMLLWLLFLLVCIYLAGFLPAVPIFLFSFLKFQGRHSWLVSILTSLLVLTFIYALFGIVLSVQFPEGIFFSD